MDGEEGILEPIYQNYLPFLSCFYVQTTSPVPYGTKVSTTQPTEGVFKVFPWSSSNRQTLPRIEPVVAHTIHKHTSEPPRPTDTTVMM